MKICSKCRVLCSDICPKCEKSKNIIDVKNDDLTLLMETNRVQIMFVEPILKEAGIPYQCKGSMGAGITAYIGNMLETYSIYVLYEDWKRAVISLNVSAQ